LQKEENKMKEGMCSLLLGPSTPAASSNHRNFIPGHLLKSWKFRGFGPGWCRQREKIDWQEALKFDCRLVRTIVVLRQFSQVVGEWLENQILIPDWTYYYCPGTTLAPS